MRPTGGRGEVFGLDIRKDSVEVRARVGNLPGEFALEDKMTGRGCSGSSPGCGASTAVSIKVDPCAIMGG